MEKGAPALGKAGHGFRGAGAPVRLKGRITRGEGVLVVSNLLAAVAVVPELPDSWCVWSPFRS